MADQPTQTQFALLIQKAMDEKGLGIKELADKTESTYEHIRKMVNGGSFPSKYFLRVLCDVLDLEMDDVNRILVADRIRHKYGKIPLELAGKNPDVEPFERLVPQLTKKQREDILAQMQAVAKRNRAEGRK